jgi:serine/threonine protein kinase
LRLGLGPEQNEARHQRGTFKMLSLQQASLSWQQLANCIDRLTEAWAAGGVPPELAPFLPADPPALRRFTLIELIKVDMEQRLNTGAPFKNVEAYAAEIPELIADGEIPCDLIYEEFHLLRGVSPDLAPSEYFRRFPRQAEQLGRLLGVEANKQVTSSLAGASRRKQWAPELGQTIDDFDLLTKLGQGAFATVFLARQRSLGRLVALKISDDKGQEPQTLAQLDHPYIVRVYDQRQLPGQRLRLLYMQYVAGGTLQEVVEYHGQLPAGQWSGATYLGAIDQVLVSHGESGQDSHVRHKFQHASWPQVISWLGSRLASALSYAHERGVLHRDVKPANVLTASDGSPKLADFNISFSSKLDGATPAAYFGGSLAYMSPEQLEACDPNHARQPRDLDGRSDVYSLAVLLWELLTGSRPFSDDVITNNWSQTLAKMSAQRQAGVPAAALARLPANCPACLRDVLLHCLVGNREERCPSAAEMSRQLDLCLQPRAQHLLQMPTDALRDFPGRMPVIALIVAGVFPNAVMSLLNTAYNWYEIVRHLAPSDQHVFVRLIMNVNGIAYVGGTIAALYLCWPVVEAIRAVRNRAPDREPLTPDWLASRRARALRLGEYVSWVSAGDWVFSGILFPTWMQAQADESTTLTSMHYVHFFISQGLCGLVAATLMFFLVTLLAVRSFYPRLVAPAADPLASGTAGKLTEVPQAEVPTEVSPVLNATTIMYPLPKGVPRIDATSSDVVLADDVAEKKISQSTANPAWAGSEASAARGVRQSAASQDAEHLLALGRRVWVYFGLAVAAPFLAVTVLVSLDIDKGAISGLGAVGLIGFALSFWMALTIRNDVAALAAAAQPAGTTLGSDTTDSFWTGSR